jgi:hypothetical protein
MIIVLTTRHHQYTHRCLVAQKSLNLRLLAYDKAFVSQLLPAATYIFSDLDRLGYWELELAAHLHRELAAAGLRVLNDPARASQRFKLLRQLRAAGLNDFDAWSLNDTRMPAPDQYPVFLRTASAHRGVLSDLLANEEQLQNAVAAELRRGIPARELLIVQYCAQSTVPGLFRKLSVYRVGERMVSSTCVHDSQWVAKIGVSGIAGQELYEDELRIVRDNPYAQHMRKVFDIANIDYGRADFGLVDGRPQVYEINTNPSIDAPKPHPFATREQSQSTAFASLLEAYASIDHAGGGERVRVQTHPMSRRKPWSEWVHRDRAWRP